MSKELSIGEVVYNNDMEMVVLESRSRETMSSTSYDRDYRLCLLSELKNNQILTEEEFNRLGYWIQIKDTVFPHIERVEGAAPFEIKSVKSYSIRQKQPKTVTVYE